MADSSEPAFLFLYRKEAVAPVDYLSTFATAPFINAGFPLLVNIPHHLPTVCREPAFLDISALPIRPLRLRPHRTPSGRRRTGCIRPGQ